MAPLLDAVAKALAQRGIGFGAPGHHGTALPNGVRKLLGRSTFTADLLTPKGLEDRTESSHALQRAHKIAAEAWGCCQSNANRSLDDALGSLRLAA